MVDTQPMAPRGKVVFAAGVSALLLVPAFKSATGLPPYLGMLAGLGGMWLLTDIIHLNEDRSTLQVRRLYARVDAAGVCACSAHQRYTFTHACRCRARYRG